MAITFNFQPVVIIGAGRSGTNILRDLLTTGKQVGTWPCDEINYIWRHGNVRFPSDEFGPRLASPPVINYVRRAFSRLAASGDLRTVVEKTCANSLRVAFVNEILPEAKFVHIIRDGRDVVASAKLRWTAKLDVQYLLRKARWVPVSDLPYYSTRYLWNRLYRLGSNQERLAFWGPRFEGMDDALESFSLGGVCALQWKRCVENAARDLSMLDASRTFSIRYEHLAHDPHTVLASLAEFLELDITADERRSAASKISPESVGKWRKQLSSSDLEEVESICGDTLESYGYL